MKTILYDDHKALGARFVNFNGWEMPLEYEGGTLAEHQAVRKSAGLFDVSHMGRISIEGENAEKFIDFLASNKIAGKKPGTATYTVLCTPSGTSLDDTIVYCEDSIKYFLIANAANRQKDFNHLKTYASPFDVAVTPNYENEGILALQGPASTAIMHKIFPESVKLDKPMSFIQTENLILSRTGYTGEVGYEIYAPLTMIRNLWEQILEEGALPIGLGARNTLRLEMGYALYGHEINETIAPIESVSRWSVKLEKESFLGKEALMHLETSPERRFAYGVVLIEPGIARDNYPVIQNSLQIGIVTSGGFSPTLNCSIALILSLVPLKKDDHVQIQIRDHLVLAKVVQIPFIKEPK